MDGSLRFDFIRLIIFTDMPTHSSHIYMPGGPEINTPVSPLIRQQNEQYGSLKRVML